MCFWCLCVLAYFDLVLRISRQLQDTYFEDLLTAHENGYIFEDEEDMYDLNETEHYPDIHDLIKEL